MASLVGSAQGLCLFWRARRLRGHNIRASPSLAHTKQRLAQAYSLVTAVWTHALFLSHADAVILSLFQPIKITQNHTGKLSIPAPSAALITFQCPRPSAKSKISLKERLLSRLDFKLHDGSLPLLPRKLEASGSSLDVSSHVSPPATPDVGRNPCIAPLFCVFSTTSKCPDSASPLRCRVRPRNTARSDVSGNTACPWKNRIDSMNHVPQRVQPTTSLYLECFSAHYEAWLRHL